jgi:hypothetical protein
MAQDWNTLLQTASYVRASNAFSKPRNSASHVNDVRWCERLVQCGAFHADSQSTQWLGWWMAEHLPHLNIKTRHSDTPRDKAEVARVSRPNHQAQHRQPRPMKIRSSCNKGGAKVEQGRRGAAG